MNAHRVFLDESGFLLIPNVRRPWAPRGQTPILRHRYRRDKNSALSAVTVSAQRRRLHLSIHVHTVRRRPALIRSFVAAAHLPAFL